jgi:hypothetical protein
VLTKLGEARTIIERHDYKHLRPHSSLGYLAPEGSQQAIKGARPSCAPLGQPKSRPARCKPASLAVNYPIPTLSLDLKAAGAFRAKTRPEAVIVEQLRVESCIRFGLQTLGGAFVRDRSLGGWTTSIAR